MPHFRRPVLRFGIESARLVGWRLVKYGMQIAEGDQFRTTETFDALCRIFMKQRSLSSGLENSFHLDEVVTIPSGWTFTVDAVNEDDIYCEFDDQAVLESELVPSRLRRGVMFARFDGCQFIMNRTVLVESCRYLGREDTIDPNMTSATGELCPHGRARLSSSAGASCPECGSRLDDPTSTDNLAGSSLDVYGEERSLCMRGAVMMIGGILVMGIALPFFLLKYRLGGVLAVTIGFALVVAGVMQISRLPAGEAEQRKRDR